MKNARKTITLVLSAALVITIVFMIASSVGFKRDSPKTSSVQYIDTMMMSIDGGEYKEVHLPAKLDDLNPGTLVTLRTTIRPYTYDGVYVKSLYTDANVYFDDNLVFTFGKKENYPDFMMNPSSEIHIIETYGTGEEMDVRIDYHSPCNDRTLFLEAPMVGTSKELIMERSLKYGMSWIMSIVLIAIGVALLILYIFVRFIHRQAVLFMWLGLFAISTGFWFFSFSEFTITVLPDTAWQYISAYIGHAVFMVPLIRFTEEAVGFRNQKPIIIMEMFFLVAATGSVVLQFAGIVPLHLSWYLFHYAIPPALLILLYLNAKEYLRNGNRFGGVFAIPSAILLISAIAENIHNPLYVHLSPFDFFQAGVVISLMFVGVVAGISIKSSFLLQKMKDDLEHEKAMIDIQTEEQKAEGLRLAENEQILSRQRHDLRHHLVMIQQLLDGNDELSQYISNLIDNIPKSQEHYCDNIVVNAIISHYAALYAQHGIEFECTLTVPSIDDVDTQSDLCAIFANLLENADEACTRMESENKYVKLHSLMQYDLLTITMDNSFDGSVKQKGNRFFSSKRNSFGIGIASIQAIVQKRNGDSRFSNDGRVFHSSLYIKLKS